jgi:hypothetical protein
MYKIADVVISENQYKVQVKFIHADLRGGDEVFNNIEQQLKDVDIGVLGEYSIRECQWMSQFMTSYHARDCYARYNRIPKLYHYQSHLLTFCDCIILKLHCCEFLAIP